jgi:hypothetical protein
MISIVPRAPDTWGRVWLRSLIIACVLAIGAEFVVPMQHGVRTFAGIAGFVLCWSSLCSFRVEPRLSIAGLFFGLPAFALAFMPVLAKN